VSSDAPARRPAGATDPRGAAVALGTGRARLARGTVAGTAGLALSLGWHATAGGGVPGIGALVLAACVAAAVCTWWAARRRGPVALLALTGSLQVGLHVLFELLAGHHGSAALLPGPGMTAAHVLAAAGVAWFLARGEDALWDVCAALTHAWAPAPAAVSPLARPAVPPLPPLRIDPAGVVLARSLPRRGPPALSMA
jgi:hypothetical protein